MNQAPELISPLDLWRQHEDIEIKSKIDERVFTDWRINQLHNKHDEEAKIIGDFNYRAQWVWDILIDTVSRSQEHTINKVCLRPSDQRQLLFRTGGVTIPSAVYSIYHT